MPPSDVYVRSFIYLFYTLIKLYYTKALNDQALSLATDWILLQRPRIPASFHSATNFQFLAVTIKLCYPRERMIITLISFFWWNWARSAGDFSQIVGKDLLEVSVIRVNKEYALKNSFYSPHTLNLKSISAIGPSCIEVLVLQIVNFSPFLSICMYMNRCVHIVDNCTLSEIICKF